MSGRRPKVPEDRTAAERRKGLTDKEIEQLELAGGVEGGMQAGSAGPKDAAKQPNKQSREDREDSREGDADDAT